MRTSILILSLSLSAASLLGCAYPSSVSGESVKNATGYPDGPPLRAYRAVACEGEEPSGDHDEYRYYLFEVDGQLRLYEYRGPSSTYMTYYTNGWTKGDEDIFFIADKLGGRTKVGELFALARDGSGGALAMYVGGRAGTKLKLEEQADGTYMASEDSTIIGAQCLASAADEPYPPKFAGPPPWAGFYTDEDAAAEAGD